MGLFDSVFFDCRKCGENIEVQSKAGECELKRYRNDNVPTDIAVSIKGEVITCENCGSVYEILSSLPDRVPLILYSKEVGDDYD